MTILTSSFKSKLQSLLSVIVSSSELHAKWLNTLSYLENCGARKIAASEHPTLVKEEMLKHAAEEFRHAHYLKGQLKKLSCVALERYSKDEILGGTATLRYLDKLDLMTSRYLNEMGCTRMCVKEFAYLLVTYAIEIRAAELYPIYHDVLRNVHSRVMVKSIMLEEEEHLNEMKNGIQSLCRGSEYAQAICKMEEKLCEAWLKAVSNQIHVDF